MKVIKNVLLEIVTLIFKPESSVRTGRGQRKDLRRQEIQAVE